jgi:hypothetical protein
LAVVFDPFHFSAAAADCAPHAARSRPEHLVGKSRLGSAARAVQGFDAAYDLLDFEVEGFDRHPEFSEPGPDHGFLLRDGTQLQLENLAGELTDDAGAKAGPARSGLSVALCYG